MVERNSMDRAFRTLGLTGEISAILMVVFGILVIVYPGLIAWIVGLYLILVGLLQLAGNMGAVRSRATSAFGVK